jgi:nicotinamide riboside kinase
MYCTLSETHQPVKGIPMKVYFVGAHSTGKTTCARYVHEQYNLPMITEVARAVLSEKELHLDSLRYNMDLVDDYQEAIFFRQVSEEQKHQNFVSDRSFDCLAYAAQHTRILPKLLKSEQLDPYITKLKSPGSFIFFVRPSKATLKADGVRESLTWDGVVAIDAMIKFMLVQWELPHFQINMDNMQERVQIINSVLTLPR